MPHVHLTVVIRIDGGALHECWNASAGGLLAALMMVAMPVAATLAALLVSSPAIAQTVDSIQVEGNRRVEVATISRRHSYASRQQQHPYASTTLADLAEGDVRAARHNACIVVAEVARRGRGSLA
jgi:alpha-beta hydrolase superfamily lysophospholipase